MVVRTDSIIIGVSIATDVVYLSIDTISWCYINLFELETLKTWEHARHEWKLRDDKCSSKQTHQVWESWRLRGRYSPAADTRTVAAAVMIKDNGNSVPCCESAQQSMKDSSITHPFTTLITPCSPFTNTPFSVALFIRTSRLFIQTNCWYLFK